MRAVLEEDGEEQHTSETEVTVGSTLLIQRLHTSLHNSPGFISWNNQFKIEDLKQIHLLWLNCIPPERYVEALTPSTCELIWQSFYRCNQVKMKSTVLATGGGGGGAQKNQTEQ